MALLQYLQVFDVVHPLPFVRRHTLAAVCSETLGMSTSVVWLHMMRSAADCMSSMNSGCDAQVRAAAGSTCLDTTAPRRARAGHPLPSRQPNRGGPNSRAPISACRQPAFSHVRLVSLQPSAATAPCPWPAQSRPECHLMCACQHRRLPKAAYQLLAPRSQAFLEHTDLRLHGGSLLSTAQLSSADDSCAADLLAFFEKRFTRTSALSL